MIHRHTPVLRRAAVLAAVALTALLCLLSTAPVASARVVLLPGAAQGGDTETFAVRLANENPRSVSTRLELSFPVDSQIPVAEVAPVKGWTSTITTRPLATPMTVGDREYREVVASIVWQGGRISSGTFEQFLLTLGPLPATGRLVLGAVQGYADGTVDRWTEPAAAEGGAGAPTIEIMPQPGAAAEPPAGATAAPSAEATTPADDDGSGGVLWVVVIGGGLLLIGAAAVGYRIRRRDTVNQEEETVQLEKTGSN